MEMTSGLFFFKKKTFQGLQLTLKSFITGLVSSMSLAILLIITRMVFVLVFSCGSFIDLILLVTGQAEDPRGGK